MTRQRTDEGETAPEVTEELAHDLALESETPTADAASFDPAPSPGPYRRRVVGPFSLRQVTFVITAVMVSAIVFTVATAPINQIVPNLPVPDPSAFLIGSPIPGLTIGDLAPELAVDKPEGRLQLTDLDGRPIRLEDLRGQAVWINYWASWCPPCQYETPSIRAIDQRYRDHGLAIVAIQVQQTVDAGRNYADRYDLEYTIGADVTGEFFHLYRVFALPTQFILDPEGRIRHIVNGPLSEARAAELIDPLLPDGPPPSAAPSAAASAG